MMRPLHVIMPMAGEGSRFLKEGWTTPKPLIELDGRPLFRHALDSVSCAGIPMKHSFVVRQEHIDRHAIDRGIREYLPEAHLFSVARTTRGAVETCLAAAPAIDGDDGVIVMDCDLEFRSRPFVEGIRAMLSRPAAEPSGGMLVSFSSHDPRYSYAETDASGRVIRTAEKEAISDHALCGAYFFSSGRGFLAAARALLAEPVFTAPEYYVSLLYNRLIGAGGEVRLAGVEEYRSYGTPEELERYL